MGENNLTYRRKVSSLGDWRDFSLRHVAFGLHRVTGWALLAWVLVHLGLPGLGGAGVWNPLTALPTSLGRAVVVSLFAVFLFHGLNGLRLLAVELLGVNEGASRRAFFGTLLVSGLLVAGLGVAL